MSARQLRLKTTTEPRPILRLSPSVCHQLGVATERDATVELHFGLRSQRVTVMSDHTLSPSTAIISTRVARRLLLPLPERLSLHAVGLGELRLGPLVGLLISNEKLQALRQGHHDTIYERYARYADELGAYLVFFALAGLDLDDDSLEAYQCRDGEWFPVLVPLPRVVYDRCFGYKARREAEMMRDIAKKRGILVVNKPVKITKLESFRVLKQDPAVSPMLPHTEPLTEQSLQACAVDFPALYLKPDNLSKGTGVFRARLKNSKWLLERSDASGHQSWILQHTDGLFAQLPSEHPYLVQQAVDLATYQGNNYDLRAAVQKDGEGQWQVAGIVARLAPERGVITSPRSGGRVLAALTALKASFGHGTGEQVLSDVEESARRIAAAVERHYGTCANLGIDLGVSKDGLVWLIEVNSRPLTVSLNRLNDPGINGRIYRYPIAYSASLDLSLPLTGGEQR